MNKVPTKLKIDIMNSLNNDHSNGVPFTLSYSGIDALVHDGLIDRVVRHGVYKYEITPKGFEFIRLHSIKK